MGHCLIFPLFFGKYKYIFVGRLFSYRNELGVVSTITPGTPFLSVF